MNIVGIVKFDTRNICVYKDVNDPLFKLRDIAHIMNCDSDLNRLITLCEQDELEYEDSGDTRICFINERGLYSILSQLREPIARKWRRVVFNQLIELRKSKNMNIVEQFEEWDHALDNIYFDEDTGMLMESVTISGGDVIQVPFTGTMKRSSPI